MTRPIIHNIKITRERSHYGIHYWPQYFFIGEDMYQSYPFKTEKEALDNVIRDLITRYKKIYNLLHNNKTGEPVCIPYGVFKLQDKYWFKMVDNTPSKFYKTEVKAYREQMKYLLRIYKRITKVLVDVP